MPKTRARTQARAQERKAQKDIRALARLGLSSQQVFALAAPEAALDVHRSTRGSYK
jgi:ABC-type transport system involved in cytochrome c biogenesis ATPase subunit